MHPRTQEVLRYFETQRATLRAAFDSVPQDQRNQPPGPGRWSPAAVVEHLALVEERISGLLLGRIAEAKAAGVAEETSTDSVLPSFNADAIVDRNTRFQAPEILQPTGLNEAEAWSHLEKATAALRATILSGDGLALATVMHPHARLGPMSVYHWIVFLGAHEARHAAQIREISTY